MRKRFDEQLNELNQEMLQMGTMVEESIQKAIESLIKAGACDCLSKNRAAMMSVYEGLVESAQNSNKKNLEGQMSLFDFGGEEIEGMSSINKLPDVTPFSKEIALAL